MGVHGLVYLFMSLTGVTGSLDLGAEFNLKAENGRM